MINKTQILRIKSIKGNVIMVDISDQACGQFAIKDGSGNNIPAKHNYRINDL